MFSVLCNDDAKARLQITPLKNGNPWICCTLLISNIKKLIKQVKIGQFYFI